MLKAACGLACDGFGALLRDVLRETRQHWPKRLKAVVTAEELGAILEDPRRQAHQLYLALYNLIEPIAEMSDNYYKRENGRSLYNLSDCDVFLLQSPL